MPFVRAVTWRLLYLPLSSRIFPYFMGFLTVTPDSMQHNRHPFSLWKTTLVFALGD